MHAKNQILLLPPYLWPRRRPASIKTSMYQSSRYQGTLDKMRRHTLGKEIEVDSEKSGWSATLPLAAPPSPSADAAAERDDRARRHTLGTLAELPATPRGGQKALRLRISPVSDMGRKRKIMEVHCESSPIGIWPGAVPMDRTLVASPH